MAEYIEREATCKDCVHYDICIFHHHGDENKKCVHFKNKADVAEVRNGEWVDYESNETYGCYESKEWYKCSCCGKDTYGRCDEDPWYSHPILSDYCPFCGAKMDGKGEE